jgi:predicted O-methyltransferase YrrM
MDNSTYAQQILQEIFARKTLRDDAGNEFNLDSNVDKEEGAFLQKLIKESLPKATIEIGCAYGISSLFICDAISETAQHTIVDPFQTTQWKNVGIAQLRKAGFTNFRLIEKKSEIALPELLAADSKFDFAFVDGWHTFDHTLLDMFYLNRMLRVGGLLVIDDVGMKAVQKALNYFLNYPAYQFHDGVSLLNTTKRNAFSKLLINPLRHIAAVIPKKIREEIFSPAVLKKSIEGYSMVALKKIKEDERAWNWFENF